MSGTFATGYTDRIFDRVTRIEDEVSPAHFFQFIRKFLTLRAGFVSLSLEHTRSLCASLGFLQSFFQTRFIDRFHDFTSL